MKNAYKDGGESGSLTAERTGSTSSTATRFRSMAVYVSHFQSKKRCIGIAAAIVGYCSAVFASDEVITAKAAAAVDKVVTIYTEQGRSSSGQGTGFLVGNSGQIATAYHVVQDSTKITIYDSSGKSYDKVAIWALEPRYDLAILKLETSPPAYLRITQEVPTAAQQLAVVGTPRGLPKQILVGRSTAAGTISSLQLSSRDGRRLFASDIGVLPVDVTIYNGLSGAPVLNANGEVVGVLSGSYDESRGIAWAIPARTLTTLLNQGPNDAKPVLQMVQWPQFSLMAPAWRTLKRSYNLRLTVRDIQKLEVLEGLLPQLRGTEWISSSTEKIVNRASACEISKTAQEVVTVTGSDVERRSLVGRFVWTFTGEGCGQQVQRQEKGDITLTVDDRRGELKFKLARFVKECESTRQPCKADDYGPQDAEPFRVISDDILTWGDEVLRRKR